MISVICYGRNDDHSPGLQKRAAMSLNLLARLLDAPGDEIVFVDANTPDELPTFPEAIADTLTPEARRRLRVLRVRPSHHAPWRGRARQPVIEPVARNAAIRRADPANGWLLSTNTDMLLVPRDGRSLSDLCADLAPRCWHLPRFELPEALWQGLPRGAPDAVLAELADLSARLPLAEVVRGADPAVFDNHGDFQLMRRADAVAVHGFDERMLNGGWAVDSNLALRLQMRLGTAGSLQGRLDGFHCAHHRVVSRMARHGRTENDYERFYRDVTRADLPHQAESWGLAGTVLEEIRLDDARRRTWIGALAAAVPAAVPPAETVYNPDAADRPDYPAEHVLVHLLDLLAERSDATVVGWCGARRRLLDLFLPAWRALGRTGAVLTAEGCVSAGPGDAGVRAAPVDGIVAEADVVVFEFGCPSQDDPTLPPSRPGAWSDGDLGALAPVAAALRTVAAAERAAVADGAAPRLLVTVNAVHNRFEPLVLDLVGAGRIPFATRLRHGYALAADPAEVAYTVPAVTRWLGARLRRRQPVPVTEAVRLMGWAERLTEEGLPPHRMADAARNAGPLLEMLAHPRFADAPRSRLDRARAGLEAARGSVRLAGRLAVPVLPDPPPEGDVRLATLEDWEEDGFAALARRHFGGPMAGNALRRSARRWSRIRVLDLLLRAGLLDPGARIAVVAAAFDPLADVLSTLCGAVHPLTPDGRPLPVLPPAKGVRDPGRLVVGTPDGAAGFDAVVRIEAAEAAPVPLRPGGRILRVEPIRIDDGARPSPGLSMSTASVDSALWPGEADDRPHFVRVAADGSVVTLGVRIG